MGNKQAGRVAVQAAARGPLMGTARVSYRAI